MLTDPHLSGSGSRSFRHLGGNLQHVPVGKRRTANLCLTFRLVLCYNIPSGGCVRLDGLPHLFIGLISYRYFTPFADSATFSVAFQTVLFYPECTLSNTASHSCRSALMRASSCTPTSDTSCWSAPLPNLLNSFGWRTGFSAPRRLSAVILCSARRSRVSSTGSRSEN